MHTHSFGILTAFLPIVKIKLQKGGLFYFNILYAPVLVGQKQYHCFMTKENYFFNTDEKTKQLIIDCLDELADLGVPVSKSVYFRQGNGTRLWGCCYLGKSTKRYSAYDYVVSINKNLFEAKDIKTTVIHELLHTIDINCWHKGLWKKWADYITENSNYTITVKAPYCIGERVETNSFFKKLSANQQKEYIDDIVKVDKLDENKIRDILPYLTNETADYLAMSMLVF